MVDVKYNNARFPDPQPFVAFSDSPELLNGKIDYSVLSIDVIGRITGVDLEALERGRRYLTTGLSTSFKTLEIGSGSYYFAQPLNLVFQESDFSTILPYSVSFIARENLISSDTTLFSGVKDIQDSWDFAEQDNKIVSATHVVKAKGEKISSQTPLQNARDFVTGRIKHHLGDTSNPPFVNFTALLTGASGFLVSRVEELDRAGGSYGITDIYNYTTAEEGISDSGIIQTNTRIDWTKEGGLTVSLDGSIIGGLTGYGHPQVTTGMFTPDNARFFAEQSLERSKSTFEGESYNAIFKKPKTYDYRIDEQANKIDFSFNFADPSDPRTDEIRHDYTTVINATKDSNVVTVDVNGTLRYNGTDLILDNNNPEASDRFKLVSGEFGKINFFGLAIRAFSHFINATPVYAINTSLNQSPKSINITKNPFESEISYNFVYDNSVDISTGALENVSFTIEKTHSIDAHSSQPTINNSFVLQSGYQTIPELTINANANIKSGDSSQNALNFFSGLVDEYYRKYAFNPSGIAIQRNYSTGQNGISINNQYIFPI